MSAEQEHRDWVRRQARQIAGLPEESLPPPDPLYAFLLDKDYCYKCGAKGVFVRMSIMCPKGHGFIGGM